MRPARASSENTKWLARILAIFLPERWILRDPGERRRSPPSLAAPANRYPCLIPNQ
jgi:hypothetical protein